MITVLGLNFEDVKVTLGSLATLQQRHFQLKIVN